MSRVALDFALIGPQDAELATVAWLLRGRREIHLSDSDALATCRMPGATACLRGAVAPNHMHGWRGTTTATIAARMALAFPGLKLIALLRDPLERARSQHRVAHARARENRSFDAAVREQLTADGLSEGRFLPDDINSYVTQGEYGRILSEYLRHFPATALHVVLESDLEAEPLDVARRVLRFLGLPADHRGGLHPPDGRPCGNGSAPFEHATDDEPIGADGLRMLRDHYAADAELLHAITGIDVPWRARDRERLDQRIAVYTAITGGKDTLEAPESVCEGCDYICFTDNPYLRGDGWQLRPLELLEGDPRRSALRPKVLAHRYLPEYATYLWVNANLSLHGDPARLAGCLAVEGMAVGQPSERHRSIYQAGEGYKRRSGRDHEAVSRQLRRYRAEGIPQDRPAPATGLIASHHHPAVNNLREAWWAEIQQGSSFDDLALGAVLWRTRRCTHHAGGASRNGPVTRWRPHTSSLRAALIRRQIERATTVALSFPKAGRSWVSYFLARYVAERTGCPLDLDLLPEGREMPPIRFLHEHIDVFGGAPAPARLLNADLLMRRRIIVLVRDPRDSLVSYWHFKRVRQQRPVPARLELFAECPVYGIERISHSTSLLLDLYDRHPGEKLLASYEALSQDPYCRLREVLRFALNGRRLDERSFREALATSSFERMREWERGLTPREARERFDNRFGATDPAAGEDYFKVRRGKVGGFESELSPGVQRHVVRLPRTAALLQRLAEEAPDSRPAGPWNDEFEVPPSVGRP